MLTETKQREFEKFVKDASHAELVWMSGFLQGLLYKQPVEEKKALAVSACSVLYGTETGNSKKLANDFAAKLKKHGVQAKLKSMDQYRLSDLEKETALIAVISTHGDGEPPESARRFYDHIHTQNLTLNKLQYAVVGLGDTAYPLFCKAGEDLDKQFERLNGQRIAEVKKCDVDFEHDAHQWLENLVEKYFLKCGSLSAESVAEVKIAGKTGRTKLDGTLLSTVNLNDIGSNKETYHIELETSEPIDYEPGDALGIVPANAPFAVESVLKAMGLAGTELFEYKGKTENAASLFTHHINILHLPERVVKLYAAAAKNEVPGQRFDLADLLLKYPPKSSIPDMAQDLISILDPIAPRLYSISSSPSMHGDSEVHITVGKHSFKANGQNYFGHCSSFLAGLQPGHSLKVYVHKNHAFKLPPPDTDVIMIGPGTGIAPFRSFLFERDATGAPGRNWLFFGEQHFISDFLYQTELQSFYERGVLTKFNAAFSRDQTEKVYVQHKMMQHADELYSWLEEGAHIYVCGTKDPMSTDVEKTLIDIISQKKKIGRPDAEAALQTLTEAGRYHKDVY